MAMGDEAQFGILAINGSQKWKGSTISTEVNHGVDDGLKLLKLNQLISYRSSLI